VGDRAAAAAARETRRLDARGDMTGGRRRAAREQGNRATERGSDGWGLDTVPDGSSK
jgi:hypothetical protein